MTISGKGSKDLNVEFGGWRYDERVIQTAIAMNRLVPLLRRAHYLSPPHIIDHHLSSPPILLSTDSHHLSRDLQVGLKCQGLEKAHKIVKTRVCPRVIHQPT